MPMLHRLSIELGFVSRYGSSPTGATADDKPGYVTISSGVMTFSTGIFLTLVRLYEPLFRVIILQNLHQFFGKIYEPKLKDSSSIAELKAQDQALNSILTSSLNVELVYVVLKSITSFSTTDTLSSGGTPNHTDGLVVTTEAGQDPIQPINMSAPKEQFEQQVAAECQKKRTQILQQIEIKMVDSYADKRISEFMQTPDKEQELE